MNVGKVMPNLAVMQVAVFTLSEKKTQMGADIRPPSVHGFKLVFQRKNGAYLISFLLF